MACCASPLWADRMVAGRPYGTLERLLTYADTVLAELDESEVDKALAGHPRIGERSKHASSRREQAGVADADTGALAALAEANRDYERRFEHVYLVCADGRSGQELLDVLRSRLDNDRATERRILRSELAKINRLRLTRMCT
jgi:2-oxo-4-hydroxy-4-carboxy-5-ureidoimidazoline decarboxylase